MSVVLEPLADDCASSRPPLRALRHVLVGHGFAGVRLVYAVLDGELLATLLAYPNRDRESLSRVDPHSLRRLRNAFRHWMRVAHPQWRRSLDCGGVLDWDLEAGHFQHHHSGYEYRWVPTCRRRAMP